MFGILALASGSRLSRRFNKPDIATEKAVVVIGATAEHFRARVCHGLGRILCGVGLITRVVPIVLLIELGEVVCSRIMFIRLSVIQLALYKLGDTLKRHRVVIVKIVPALEKLQTGMLDLLVDCL